MADALCVIFRLFEVTVNAQDHKGKTALHLAIEKEYFPRVEVLLSECEAGKCDMIGMIGNFHCKMH